MRSPPRLARRRRSSSISPPPSAAGESGERFVWTRQDGARVEYIGRATIRPGTDHSAFDIRFGTCPAALQPGPMRACRPAGRLLDDAFVVSDARARLAAHLAQSWCG